MYAENTERRSASAVEPLRCTRCDGTFKRLEHLRRHERVHDNKKRFACKQCSKPFTRSDILRRHEATHAATVQADKARTVRTRACTECARCRERCTKSDPCQRCLARGLHCTYPQARASVRIRQPSSVYSSTSQAALDPAHQALTHHHDLVNQRLSPDRLTTSLLGSDATNAQNTFTPYQQSAPFEIPEYRQNQLVQPTMDFSMNWLPPDNSIPIDYDSIVGLGVGSLDFFSLPNPSTEVAETNTAILQEPVDNASLGLSSAQNDTMAPCETHTSSVGNHGSPWNDVSPEAVDSYVSSDSPHSATHTVSPSSAPGGLYATSFNGARMPCTIRARRASRLIPGAHPIRPLNEVRPRNHVSGEEMEFPDTSHIPVHDETSSIDSILHGAKTLTKTVYEDMQRNYSKLCLGEGIIFPSYKSSRYPDLPTLNMFVQLYFDNFDVIMPIMHDHVAHINDHWILALAVCAIGCQYAEADEFSQTVEPLHEFLRRAIMAESTDYQLQNIARDTHGITLALAMTLSHIGMLYSGSSRLLHYAKAQHGAMTAMARTLAFQPTTSEPVVASSEFDTSGNADLSAWRKLMLEECKRRVGFAIWLLDCMAVYHFQQQPLMPPDLVSVSLPNDKLWQSQSPSEWAMHSVSMQGKPSLTSATVSLFREKQIMQNLGQFSHVLLLHGVYREIFQLKYYFLRPLGNWIPSIQQTAFDNNNNCNSPSIPDRGGESLLNSWRNAALDCVDVLHWAANGTIALQAGTEHPTVLHLHLSRTVLLAPLNRFETLAESIASFAQDPTSRALDASSRKKIIDIERDILEWAQRDQFKARLAVLHSGCLFWHIRRYSYRAFYEPIAVFLATLTMWAYSSYASRMNGINQDPHSRPHRDVDDAAMQMHMGDDSHSVHTAHSSAPEDPEPAPTFIHLDRPNDDEMVQFFVRFGTSTAMRANITGVGDIYSAEGPARILKEGRKILAAVSTAWGRTDRFSHVLEVLEQVASGRVPLGSSAA